MAPKPQLRRWKAGEAIKRGRRTTPKRERKRDGWIKYVASNAAAKRKRSDSAVSE